MHDTHPDIEKRFKKLIMTKSPEERFYMAISMMHNAKKALISHIKYTHPEFSDREVKDKILKLWYKFDKSG